jgi:hypothetical protein
MEPREEGVDFLNLDKRKTLIFWARGLNSKDKDIIIRRLKRDEIGCIRNACFGKTCTERQNWERTNRRNGFREDNGKNVL